MTAKYLALPVLLFGSLLMLTSAVEKADDLEAVPSIASDYKVQAVESNNKYGYPYRVAPTLGPRIQARSDDDESEAVQAHLPAAKPYGSRIPSTADDGEATAKKAHPKKAKVQYASRRQDGEDALIQKRFWSYIQPKYRNFDELEADFQPRRMDVNIPYSQYEYTKSSLRKPVVSPIDPYLTPSADPGDTFYPVPKIKAYPPSSYGHSHDGPSYGAGHYDEPSHYHDSSYGGPSSYGPSGGPPSSYTSSGGSSSSYPSGGQYDYHENYSIKSNEPIIGSIRKRLLDYAGASNFYEGEPDYLRQVSRSKYKYGNLGNDYYSYGGPVHRDSYRDFPYVESKISLIKKSRGL